MDVNVWTRLNRLLDEALDLPPEERARWLSSLGPEHEAVKPSLVALLAHAPALADARFLDTLPPVDLDDRDRGRRLRSTPIGPYRLLREIGRGGMGTVWLAERADGMIRRAGRAEAAARRLAACGARRSGCARERDILAALTHPHIARLYDAGVTPEGQPYLALEYVEGAADRRVLRRAASRRAGAAALFLQVAGAGRVRACASWSCIATSSRRTSSSPPTARCGCSISASPSCSTKADEGRPRSPSSRAGPLTPEYASPEQIAGEPLGTASDVYSLGVVLYELLAGARPYTAAARFRCCAAGRDRPGRLSRRPARRPRTRRTRAMLRGDLDTIVLKALKKKPGGALCHRQRLRRRSAALSRRAAGRSRGPTAASIA